jgi:hypothetical protein
LGVKGGEHTLSTPKQPIMHLSAIKLVIFLDNTQVLSRRLLIDIGNMAER